VISLVGARWWSNHQAHGTKTTLAAMPNQATAATLGGGPLKRSLMYSNTS
jgi:hypothetical protein